MAIRTAKDGLVEADHAVETFSLFHRHAALGHAESLPEAARLLRKRGVEGGASLAELADLDTWAVRGASQEVVQHAIDLYFSAIEEVGGKIPDPRATRLDEARKALRVPEFMAGSYVVTSLERLLPDELASLQTLMSEWEQVQEQFRDRFRGELDRIKARLDTLDGLDLAPPASKA